jgi:hypothetical protein
MMFLEVSNGFIRITNSSYSNYGALTWSPLGHVGNTYIVTLSRIEHSRMNFVLGT